MSPLGSSVDDGSRKPRGTERPELKRLQEGPPQTPNFQRLTDQKAKKRLPSVLLQMSMVLFIVLPLPVFLPFSSSLFLRTTNLQKPSLICLAQRPGEEKADRCLVTCRPAQGLCTEMLTLCSPVLPAKEREGNGQHPAAVWSHSR